MKTTFDKTIKELNKISVDFEITKNNRIVIDAEWSNNNLDVFVSEDSEETKTTKAGIEFRKIYDKLENEFAEDSGVDGGGYYVITQFETFDRDGVQVSILIKDIADDLEENNIDFTIKKFDEIEISMYEDISDIYIGTASTELFQEEETVSIIDN